MNWDRIRLEEANQVVEWLRGRRFGVVEVVEARAALEVGPLDDDAVMFRLVLSNPPPGLRTWPYEDMRDLRHAVNVQAGEVELTGPWYVLVNSQREVAAGRAARAAQAAG
ncbi:MAG TPA: hypothetical protein VNA20_17220 [Frankiaceae bacterium]|nr:hypothetical protein [Frankiaceae bacterium]